MSKIEFNHLVSNSSVAKVLKCLRWETSNGFRLFRNLPGIIKMNFLWLAQPWRKLKILEVLSDLGLETSKIIQQSQEQKKSRTKPKVKIFWWNVPIASPYLLWNLRKSLLMIKLLFFFCFVYEKMCPKVPSIILTIQTTELNFENLLGWIVFKTSVEIYQILFLSSSVLSLAFAMLVFDLPSMFQGDYFYHSLN